MDDTQTPEETKVYKCNVCQDSKTVGLMLHAAGGERIKQVPCPECGGPESQTGSERLKRVEERLDGIGKLILAGVAIILILAALSFLEGKKPDSFAEAVKEVPKNE